jgi:GNAT superfamily N-acetyltransferase
MVAPFTRSVSHSKMDYVLHTNKDVTANEFSALMDSVGWGSDYPEELVRRSIMAYPFVAHACRKDGKLLGYVSAFSDQAFSTMLGELVVHPEAQGQGIGRALLLAAEQAFPGIPIYVKPLPEAKEFFLACGYKYPAKEMTVLFKRNASTTANNAFNGASVPPRRRF